MTETISLTIDGIRMSATPEEGLVDIISRAGTDTPLICAHPATTSEGLCRICVVEVEGWRTLAPACVTKAADGMVISTNSERVTSARRTILEMLNASTDLSAAPSIQKMLEEYHADLERFPHTELRQAALLDDNPFYIRDYEKCILCWRCVQACGDDLQFSYALSVGGRGYQSRIATFFDTPLPETTCVFCGNCVAVCPTNALLGKTEFFLNQGLDQIRQEKHKSRKQMRREENND